MAIDLRSDTVTRPDQGMRQAMMQAEVGDDVFGDDPTIKSLQERVACLLGQEAALFTPSGTMANQLALRSQTEPGDEVLLDSGAHVLNYESGAAAALSGLQFRCLDSPRGGFRASDLEELRRPDFYVFPRLRLVEMENTHNHRGGEVFRLERMQEVYRWAKEHGFRVHLDGARLWNASIATGVQLSDYGACADTISVCFSKGLGAPVGSALVGDTETIRKAHRLRKMLGGGMRQSGILAAAALHALDHNFDRLREDHENARFLAEIVEKCSGLALAWPVETNIIIIAVTQPEDSAASLIADLEREGVWATVWEQRTIRLVTHLDVSRECIERAAEALKRLRG